MPQKLCCVSSCTSAEIDGAVLHGFPDPSINRARFNVWVTNAGLCGEDQTYVFKNRKICRLHFEERYYSGKNRLTRSAFPTLRLPNAVLSEYVDNPVYLIYVDQAIPSTSEKSCCVGELSSDLLQSHKNAVPNETVENPVPMFDKEIPLRTYNRRSAVVECSSDPKQSNNTLVPDKFEPSTTSKKESIANAKRSLELKYGSEFDLYKTIAKTKYQLTQFRKAKAGLVKELKLAKKLTQSQAYKIVAKKLSPAAKIFFDMQIRQFKKKPKGHRFTLDEKILALSLYKPSPKAYRLLNQICVLPKKSTLNNLMKKAILYPGPNEVVLQHLKKRVDKMPNSHKYCTLIFDEMAIAANICYDKQYDNIKGFCDDGSERTKSFADHALVFMVRGILKKYKQPVAYSFCTGATPTNSLKKQLKEILEYIMDAGLKVVATTCDQGSTNMAAINQLLKETKEKYVREGKEYRGGFFEIKNEIIYPIYDPPHLMKGIRNNLLTKDLEFVIDGKKHIAKWSHIEALYKKGPAFKGLRLVPKLTARHVIPSLIPKMKVKYCTQVFSQTVSVAMGFTAETGRIPEDSKGTAELLLFFDKMFDSVNGHCNKVVRGKVYRSAVSPKSPHNKLWHKSLPVLKSMKYISVRGGVVPSISSWIKTIEAFQQITKKLHNLGLRSLLLRNFNQDPLENFFGAIRAHGHQNVMPTSVAFEASYKALLINNMVSPKSVGANCENDDSICLQSLKYFLNQDITLPPPKNIEIDMNHFNFEVINVEILLQSKNPRDIEKCAAAAYCSGWIINVLYKLISKNCEECKRNLEGDGEEIFCKYITLKKYTNKCILHYPSKYLLECLLNIEMIAINILKTNCDRSHILEYIELVVTSLVSLNFLTCVKHHDNVKKILLKKGILLVLNDWCKEVNNLLCGKSVEYDEDDPIKLMAKQYCLKHKCKNKK